MPPGSKSVLRAEFKWGIFENFEKDSQREVNVHCNSPVVKTRE